MMIYKMTPSTGARLHLNILIGGLIMLGLLSTGSEASPWLAGGWGVWAAIALWRDRDNS